MESLHSRPEYSRNVRQPPPVLPKPSRERLSKQTPLRVSSSTTSLETPLSPQWSLAGSSESANEFCKPCSSSITKNEEAASSQSLSPPTHIYPSPPHTIDYTTVSPTTRAKALSLQELVEKYSQSFPLQIKVVHGYSGQTHQLTLSSGDYYNIHFVKHQEVVSMNDKLGFNYTIPINTSFQFGIVYSEDNQRALETQNFEKVADLLMLSPLPKVACATRDVKGSDDKSSIVADEILVIKRVIRPKLRKKLLEVLSLKTQNTKSLPLDCEGHFTLNPRRNLIYLLELVRCIPGAFPCEALMFIGDEPSSNQQRISPSLVNTVVTLTGQKMETSLIASSVIYEGGVDVEPQISEHLVDIPVDERLGEVKVVMVNTSEHGLQEVLNHKTRTIFETFDVTRVKSWYDVTSENTQNLLYTSIGKGSEKVGMQVEKPIAAYFNKPVIHIESNSREDALYETVCSPTLEDTYPSSVEQPHCRSFPASSNDFATQYEQPHLSMSSITSSGATWAYMPKHLQANELHYDPLPLIPQVAPTHSPSVLKGLHRSNSQHTLPRNDLFPDCYEDMHPSVVSPFTSHTNIELKLGQLMATTNLLKTQVTDLTRHISHMESQIKDMSEISATMKQLLEGISVRTSQSQTVRFDGGIGRAGAEREAQMIREEVNRHYLGKLSMTQVKSPFWL